MGEPAVVWAVCDKDGKPVYVGIDEKRALNFAMNSWSGEGKVSSPIACVVGPDPAHARVAAVIRAALDCGNHDRDYSLLPPGDVRLVRSRFIRLMEVCNALTPEDLARFGIVEGK